MRDKTALHEIGHQLLKPGGKGSDNSGHQGNAANIVAYNDWITAFPAPTGSATAQAAWYRRFYNFSMVVNVMNEAAMNVPYSNPKTPFDLYYFQANDIDEIRRLSKSPG